MLEIFHCPEDNTELNPVIPSGIGAYKANGEWRVPKPESDGSISLVPDEFYCSKCGVIWAIKRVGIVP